MSVIEDVHEYSLCNAFAMKIGSIWFVEFGEKPNACYPYEDDKYQLIRLRWGRLIPDKREKTDSLKDKSLVYQPDYGYYTDGEKRYVVGDGRMIHMPKWSEWDSGWHWKFEVYIAAFCEVTLE